MIINKDCLEALKELPDNSIDSIVTDPPYGLSFMGKKWDYDVPSTEIWSECLRVLKPGGYLLAFAGTRTQHRMAVRIEDAGFEIRDMIAWIYGSGFPKSLNIAKQIDKMEGVGHPKNTLISENGSMTGGNYTRNKMDVQSDLAKQWEGWGTALKPALEPITVARKPIEGTVAENCLKWGVGGINIDESRVDTITEADKNAWKTNRKIDGGSGWSFKGKISPEQNNLGRFPANLITDGSEEVLELFPDTVSKWGKQGKSKGGALFGWEKENADESEKYIGDSGSAARFFYCAKSSRSERNKGLDGTLTVKYTGDICKEENMVAVQLLKKVISDTAQMSFSTGESGESLMVQFPKDSSSTIKTIINEIMTSQILNLLTHSLTNESTQGVNLEMGIGGSPVENVESLKKWILTTTNGQMELALGANRVALQMLSLINEEENWKEATNFHSTVKPIKLMEYLVNLVSKEGHTVLDPFCGSGTTGIACKKLNRNFIGIERDGEYCKIAEARINNLF